MRRCNTEACHIKAGQVSRFNLNLPIAQILYNPIREWNTVTGNVRTASENDGKIDWKRYGTDKYLLSHATIVSSVQTEDNGYHIKPACSKLVNINGNAWDDPVLMATFKTFIGGDNFVEHDQRKEVSKGRLLDAVARPVHYVDEETGLSEDIHYIDILVATERKHTDLVASIESGEMSAMSMGCTANYVRCSQCGRVFGDEELDMDASCVHLKTNMGGTFVDENGIVRKCAELVGRTIEDENGNVVGDPESMEFIEASWVKNPAFKGAVINHFISDIGGDNTIVGFEGSNNLMANVFNMRVADRGGALALRVARQEILRQRREELIARVAQR